MGNPTYHAVGNRFAGRALTGDFSVFPVHSGYLGFHRGTIVGGTPCGFCSRPRIQYTSSIVESRSFCVRELQIDYEPILAFLCIDPCSSHVSSETE
jgi:hypothetical protein